MARKVERPVNRRGAGTTKGKGQQNSVAKAGEMKIGGEVTPILVDANEGARILGIGLPTFYKFTRRNEATPTILLGSLQRWKRHDILRIAGKKIAPLPVPEDVLVDAKTISKLCSISRPLFYKLNQLGVTPEPILDGRTLRWSFHEIVEWIEEGCPQLKTKRRRWQ